MVSNVQRPLGPIAISEKATSDLHPSPMGDRIDQLRKTNETHNENFSRPFIGDGESAFRITLGPLSRHDHVSPRVTIQKKKIGDRPAKLIRGCVGMAPWREAAGTAWPWAPWSCSAAIHGVTS